MKTVLTAENNIRSREMPVKIMENLREDVIIKTASGPEEACIRLMNDCIDLFMPDFPKTDEEPRKVFFRKDGILRLPCKPGRVILEEPDSDRLVRAAGTIS